MWLIDGDALMNTLQKFFDKREKEQIFTGGRGADVTWNDAIYHIKSAPTVDAVPVVRCKECKWWRGPIYGNRCSYHSGPNHTEFYDADEFCSRGERKGGDE